MADDADLANELIELQLQAKLKEAIEKEVPVNDTGLCWCCGETVPDNRRWCSAECRDLDIRSK